MEMKHIVVLSLLMSVIGITAYFYFSYYVPASSCQSKGGVWGSWGALAEEGCNLPASDVGKSCSDSSGCDGACVANLSQNGLKIMAEGGTVRTAGNCTARKIVLGCNILVENGTADRVCAD